MSAHHVWGQRGRVLLPQPTERGPNGRKLCRLCHEEVPPGRQSWCSEACVQAGALKVSWPAMRAHIERRDRVCQLCGTDHPGLHFGAALFNWRGLRYREHGPFRLPPSHPWEVDHILPVSAGGTDDPANLRLLCRRCHLAVTREWRRSKSKKGGAA